MKVVLDTNVLVSGILTPYPKLSPVADPAREIVAFFRGAAIRAGAIPLSCDLPDASDLLFLEVASAAGAVLVTGNVRHFPAGACGRVTVTTPAGLLDRLRRPPG